jgi:hypothetical protein
MRPNQLAAIVVWGLICVGAAIGIALVLRHDPFGSALAIGVLAGLIVIVIGAAAKAGLIALHSASGVPPTIPGLVRIAPKSSIVPEEWMDLIAKAHAEFFLAGHSLGKWCGESHREEFLEHIVRILSAEGSVKLLTLGPGSSHLQSLKLATDTDYTKRVAESREFLSGLLARLTLEQCRRLTISVLPEHANLPYTVAGNERTLITATYLSSRDSDEVPCLQLERDSGAAISIYDDFCLLVKQGEAFVPEKTLPGRL